MYTVYSIYIYSIYIYKCAYACKASNVPTPILWHRLSEENRIGQDSKLGPYEKGNPFSDFTKMISSLKSVVAEMNVVKPLECHRSVNEMIP